MTDTPIAPAVLADPTVQAAIAAAEKKATAPLIAAGSAQVTAAKASAFDKIVATVKSESASVAGVLANVERLIVKDEGKFAKWIKGHSHTVAIALSAGALVLAGFAAYKLW